MQKLPASAGDEVRYLLPKTTKPETGKMHGITKREWRQTKWQLANRLWLLFLLGIVFTSSTGKPLESSLGGGGVGGWTVWLPWLEWGGAVLSVSWPWLGQQLELRGGALELEMAADGEPVAVGGAGCLAIWSRNCE